MNARSSENDGLEPLLLSRQEVAQLLGVSEKHVYRLDKKGMIPKSRKLLSRVVYSRKKIEEWIEADCPALAV